jgi:HlyD family secretion protein
MRNMIIIGLLVLLIALLVSLFFITNPEEGRAVLVELGIAVPETEVYRATGILETETTIISSLSGGMVEAIPIDIGRQVLKGKTVAQLETELINAQFEVARANLQAARAQQSVITMAPRAEDIRPALATVELAKTYLDIANQSLEDALALKRNDPTRNKKIDISRAQVDQANFQLRAAQTALAKVRSGASDSEQEAAIIAVREAELALETFVKKIEDQTLIAPISGIVMQHLIQPGEIALAGWPILTISDIKKMELTVFIPQGNLNWVKEGDRVPIIVDIYPDERFYGEIISISDKAEFTPRNVQTPDDREILVHAVKIRVPNDDNRLKPGLYAEATFEVIP